jgi:uncharacterized protein (DUF1800 family)
MTTSDWDPDDLKARFITALSDAGQALEPLIAQLRREGRGDEATEARDQQGVLYQQSSTANAILVEQMLAAAKDDMDTLAAITQRMKADAERLAKSEANVQRFIAIATDCTKIVGALSPAGSLADLGSNLVSLQAQLSAA